jgi:hypothetical protein
VDQLHQVMRENGLIRERGNGLVITAEDGTMVSATRSTATCPRASWKPGMGRSSPPHQQGRPAEQPRASISNAQCALG